MEIQEPRWGWWAKGPVFIPLPKRPLIDAGFTQPPFTVTRPDGMVLRVVEETAECPYKVATDAPA